ncbi:MAG: hypothetical protein HYZ14_08390 [Bacteroidetes bacterium]|nr:hypothetical protein [Bacteroidota bacterium]
MLNAEDEALQKHAASVFRNAEINVLYPRSSKQDKSPNFCFSVHSSDFNLTGNLKNDKIAGLLQTEFDLLIDLSDDSGLLKYLAQSINASLVIGTLEMAADGSCDLFFDKLGTNSEFLGEIVKQLNQLIKK